MAKRFTDTDKWKKKWFRKLPVKYKALWQYLTDNCDKCGVWEVDFELAEIFIGEELNIDEIKDFFKKQYVELDGGKRWFIIDFIEFQYGLLNPNNPAHKNVYKELLERNLIDSNGAAIKELHSTTEGAIKGLGSTFEGTKDKEKDKEEVKDKDMVKEEIKEEPTRKEIRTFFLLQNSTEDEADLFYAHYAGKDWKVFIRDGPERSIRQTRKWQLKAEEWIKRTRIEKIDKDNRNGQKHSYASKGQLDQDNFAAILRADLDK